MCDPVTLTFAATAIAATSSIIGGISTYNQENYAAQVSERNAQYADQQTADALARGQKAEQAHYIALSHLKGEQQAAMAANGVDLSFGSPLDIQTDTAILGEADAQTIRDNASREALGYTINAVNYRAQASADRQAGAGALVGGFLGAAGTILGGASQAKTGAAKYGTPSWMNSSVTNVANTDLSGGGSTFLG